MKFYSLSLHPNKPCSVLKFKNTRIMLDCGLDGRTVLNFLPLPLVPNPQLSGLPQYQPKDGTIDAQTERELKECNGHVFVDSEPEFGLPLKKLVDFADIDVILVSNYLCMLALPFITEDTGFKGVVYMTEPTLHIGRMFMEEMVEFIEQSPKPKQAKFWKDFASSIPLCLKDGTKPRNWTKIYSMKTVNSALQKVKMVGFSEKKDVFGAVDVCAVSSGYCLGSSNWLITSRWSHEKIAYICGSSTLTTHPRQMDQGALRDADVLILTALTQTPNLNPDSSLGEFCMHVAITLRNNGNVLVPVYPSGVIYDLFECLSGHLESSGLSQVPMFFLSPVADKSLAYSNIFAEWLSSGKQNKVYLPEEPFPHALLVSANRLQHFPHLHSEAFSNAFRQPCVVFCGHPSLRFGDAVHFINLWGSSERNMVVFTEPDFPWEEALRPFAPLAMKAVHCPIDTSLSFSQANKLLRDLKPKTLILPQKYTHSSNHKSDIIEVDPANTTILPFSRGEVAKPPLQRSHERVLIDSQLGGRLNPTEVQPGVYVATMASELNIQDNHYDLKPLPSKNSKVSQIMQKPGFYTWGQLDVSVFLKKLADNGITDAKLEEISQGVILHLQNEDTIIQIDETSTHIVCNGGSDIRAKLRDILVRCLNKF